MLFALCRTSALYLVNGFLRTSIAIPQRKWEFQGQESVARDLVTDRWILCGVLQKSHWGLLGSDLFRTTWLQQNQWVQNGLGANKHMLHCTIQRLCESAVIESWVGISNILWGHVHPKPKRKIFILGIWCTSTSWDSILHSPSFTLELLARILLAMSPRKQRWRKRTGIKTR